MNQEIQIDTSFFCLYANYIMLIMSDQICNMSDQTEDLKRHMSC